MRTSVVNVPVPAARNQPVGSRPHERWLGAIRDFLSAPAMAELLAGQWQAIPVASPGEKDHAAFIITSPAGQSFARVIVDLHTYLPVSLATFPAGSGAQLASSRPLLSARFQWEKPSAAGRQP
jgi:hypothetical protein